MRTDPIDALADSSPDRLASRQAMSIAPAPRFRTFRKPSDHAPFADREAVGNWQRRERSGVGTQARLGGIGIPVVFKEL
jgi:hypothetical protein